LSSSDNLTSNNQKTEHVQTQTNINTKVALINNNTHTKTYTNTKDRVWFSHIYNIQSGNEAGQFLQPRSPHGFRLAIECTQYAVVFIRIHPSMMSFKKPINQSQQTDQSLFVLTAIVLGVPGLASFIEAKDDGSGGGDNWSYKSRKVPVKSSPPTNQHPTVYRPDAIPVAQPTVSEH